MNTPLANQVLGLIKNKANHQAYLDLVGFGNSRGVPTYGKEAAKFAIGRAGRYLARSWTALNLVSHSDYREDIITRYESLRALVALKIMATDEALGIWNGDGLPGTSLDDQIKTQQLGQMVGYATPLLYHLKKHARNMAQVRSLQRDGTFSTTKNQARRIQAEIEASEERAVERSLLYGRRLYGFFTTQDSADTLGIDALLQEVSKRGEETVSEFLTYASVPGRYSASEPTPTALDPQDTLKKLYKAKGQGAAALLLAAKQYATSMYKHANLTTEIIDIDKRPYAEIDDGIELIGLNPLSQIVPTDWTEFSKAMVKKAQELADLVEHPKPARKPQTVIAQSRSLDAEVEDTHQFQLNPWSDGEDLITVPQEPKPDLTSYAPDDVEPLHDGSLDMSTLSADGPDELDLNDFDPIADQQSSK